MTSRRCLAIVAIMLMALTAFVGCKKIPDEVIGVDDMAELLADVHTAEAVVEIDQRDYGNDSLRQLLKQSVFVAHNVTQEQFDSSMMWYGRNIDKYIEVYDKVIEILETRSQQAGIQMVQDAQQADGDSVDVWSAPRYMVVNDRVPGRYLGFDMPVDTAGAMAGDSYTWRLKVVGIESGSLRWQLMANYADSTFDYINTVSTNSPARHGWNEVTFVTDSTKVPVRLRGVFELNITEQPEIWIDSISLVRKRLDIDRYRTRSRQKTFAEYYPVAPADTAATDTTIDR